MVFDAETDRDLATIARVGLALSPLPALAGSAGLARALGEIVLGPRPSLSWAGPEAGPILAVLASSSAALAVQVDRAAQLPDVSVLRLRCQHLSHDEGPMPEVHNLVRTAVSAVASGRTALIHAAGPLPPVDDPVALVVEHLAHLTFVVMKEGEPRGLLVGGGSTAQGVLQALGVEAIQVDDEPKVGVAAGLLIGGHADGCPVALKPGAAGDEDAVLALLRYLRRRAAATERKQ